MKVSNGIFGVVLLLPVIGLFQGCTEIEEPSNKTSQVTVKKEESKPRVYIDEIGKLQGLTQQLIDYKYVPPYSSYEVFSRIKENLAIGMEPTCNYFDELMKSTGNINSPHLEDSIRCSDTVLSMTAVLFDIRDGDHNAIQEQRRKLIIINDHLVKQLDEYRNTPEYKAEMEITKLLN
jgi:hypothetical protein